MSSQSICKICAPSSVVLCSVTSVIHCKVLSPLVEYWVYFLIEQGHGNWRGISSWALCPFGLGCIYQHTAMIPPMCDFLVSCSAIRASQRIRGLHFYLLDTRRCYEVPGCYALDQQARHGNSGRL